MIKKSTQKFQKLQKFTIFAFAWVVQNWKHFDNIWIILEELF